MVNIHSSLPIITKNNQTKENPNWDITFDNLNIKAATFDGHQYSPIYFGAAWAGDNAAVTKENQKNIKVTFNNVNADVTDRPIISGFMTNWMGAADISGEAYTLVLKGNNNLTSNGYTGGSTPGDAGDAITAGNIIVEDGTTTVNMTRTSSYNLQYGGAAIRTSQPDTADSYTLDVKQGATLNVNGGKDVKGIVTANATTGTVNIDGTVNINMGTGHSIAVLAGNLNVGKTGDLEVQTQQLQNTDKTIANFNSGQYGVLSIGVGYPANLTNQDANTINDNGIIKVVRTATGETLSPIISMGSGSAGLLKGDFTVNVNQGATLDLQDSASQTGLGMIAVCGSSVKSFVNFTNPGYVNLQRLNALPKNGGDLVYLEGQPNGVTIAQSPIAQWDEANMTKSPSFTWIVNNVSSMNNWGTNASSGFAAAGQTAPENQKGQLKFLHSNGTVSMAPSQSGLNSYQYNGGQKVNKDSDQGIIVQGTAPDGSDYYEPYLVQFLNNFNYWTPQRLAMGAKLLNTPAVTVKDSDKYQPETQTINGKTNQTLADLKAADGIKDYIENDGSTSKVVPDLKTTVTWYDPSTDATEWTSLMGTQSAPTNPTGNLKTTDKSAWAKVTYEDGSVDFVNIPLNITNNQDQDSDLYQPTYDPMNVKQDETKTEDPTYTTKQDGTITINPDSRAPEGTKYEISNPSQVPFATVDSSTGKLTIAPTKDNSKTGLTTVPVTVTYPDKSTDTVNVPVYIGDTVHTGTITTELVNPSDPNGPKKATGAYAVVTDPAAVKAHETSVNSMDPAKMANNAVSAINHYTINPDGTVSSKVDPIDKSTAKIAWSGETPNTVVTTPTASKNLTGTVSVTVDDTTVDSNEMTIVAPGATAKDVTTPVRVVEGQSLTSAQGKALIDTTNLDKAGIKYNATWATTPKAGDTSATIRLTFTDKDAQGNFTYLDVPTKPGSIEVVPEGEYAPSYKPVSVEPGKIVTDPVISDTKTPEGTTFTKGTGNNVPTWATVDPSTGTITLKPGADVTPGHYEVPVTVKVPGKPDQTITAPVTVTGMDHEHNTWYGNQSSISFTTPTVPVHRTTNGYEIPVAEARYTTIEYQYDWQGGNNYGHKVTYTLQGDKYVGDNGKSFDASATQISWVPAGNGVLTPNTNWKVTTDDTGSILYDQAQAPDSPEQTTDGESLPGNSHWRMNYKLGDLRQYIGIGNSSSWSNVYFNFYGATTGKTLTFKQGEDISNLTQDKYRQLIDVTDLGQAGWNGQNVNPNAPQVLAYVEGTDAKKQFTMTWAPNGQPLTATVANGVKGVVRIIFNDGTYLDVPAAINVIADPDAGKTDQDKTEFSQKIVYTYNGKEIATININNIKKGSDVSADTLKSTIDGNVPSNYQIADGYTYQAGLTNVSATPDTIEVPLTLKSGETFNATGKSGVEIKSNKGDTLTAALLHDLADQSLPEGYEIVTYPGSYNVESDGFTIPVIVKKSSTKVNYDPTNKDMNRDVVRTITIYKTDGTTQTVTQDVHFVRGGEGQVAETIDPDGQMHWTPWTVATKDGNTWKSNGAKATTGAWEEYDVDQVDGYTSTVDGKNAIKVAANNNITADTANANVTVAYTKATNPDDHNIDPTNPGESSDMFAHPTRTINVTDPTTGAINTTKQTVWFGRTKTVSTNPNAYGKGKNTKYGDWKLGKVVDGHFVIDANANSAWPEFDAPTFDGYTPSQAKVDAQKVEATTGDTEVNITYTQADNGNHDKGGNTTPTPTPGDNGDHNNGNGEGNGIANNNGDVKNTNNGASNNANNNKHALPQTGNDQSAAVAGLGLAGLTTMLGLAGLKKRKND